MQVGAFSSVQEATELRERLRAAGFDALTYTVNTDGGLRTRIGAGPMPNRAEADALNAQVRALTGLNGMVRPHP